MEIFVPSNHGFIKLRSMITGGFNFVRTDEIKLIVGANVNGCLDDKPPRVFADQHATEWTNVYTDKLCLHVADTPEEIYAAIERRINDKTPSIKTNCDEEYDRERDGWDGIK